MDRKNNYKKVYLNRKLNNNHLRRKKYQIQVNKRKIYNRVNKKNYLLSDLYFFIFCLLQKNRVINYKKLDKIK